MKFLIATVFIFLTLFFVETTFASIVPHWPTMDFNGHAVPINKICTTSQGYRTVEPQTICTDSKVLARYACSADNCRLISSAAALRKGEIFRVGRECLKYETFFLNLNRPTDRNFVVPLIQEDISDASPVVDTFQYIIPACKN